MHHANSNGVIDCIYKRPVAMLCGDGGNVISDDSRVVSSKDGWMVFVRRNDGLPIIVNPLTGAQLIHPLPSLPAAFFNRRRRNIQSIAFFPDNNNVALVECRLEDDYHVLAAATPGDDEWSAARIPKLWLNSSIVFHGTENKFYILNRHGNMHSFRLVRCCCGRKTVFRGVSCTLARATRPPENLSFYSRLMIDGKSLLQVRKCFTFKRFDIFKYCPDEDMWVKMTDMDFGYNALFFDFYGVRMLPLPHQRKEEEEEEGRLRRNCIYFTNYEIKNGQYIHYVGMYDIGKGTVKPYFSTINVQSYRNFLPAIMWFTPSLSINN